MYGVPNTTFCTQPCDMGIIKDFKNIYRRKVLRNRIFSGIKFAITRTRACVFVADAWEEMLA